MSTKNQPSLKKATAGKNVGAFELDYNRYFIWKQTVAMQAEVIGLVKKNLVCRYLRADVMAVALQAVGCATNSHRSSLKFFDFFVTFL